MKKLKNSILFITPVKHIKGFSEIFSQLNINLVHCPNPFSYKDLPKDKSIIAIFTNPNKSNIFIDLEILKIYPNLKVITTASTGTVHINKKYNNFLLLAGKYFLKLSIESFKKNIPINIPFYLN